MSTKADAKLSKLFRKINSLAEELRAEGFEFGCAIAIAGRTREEGSSAGAFGDPALQLVALSTIVLGLARINKMTVDQMTEIIIGHTKFLESSTPRSFIATMDDVRGDILESNEVLPS